MPPNRNFWSVYDSNVLRMPSYGPIQRYAVSPRFEWPQIFIPNSSTRNSIPLNQWSVIIFLDDILVASDTLLRTMPVLSWCKSISSAAFLYSEVRSAKLGLWVMWSIPWHRSHHRVLNSYTAVTEMRGLLMTQEMSQICHTQFLSTGNSNSKLGQRADSHFVPNQYSIIPSSNPYGYGNC